MIEENPELPPTLRSMVRLFARWRSQSVFYLWVRHFSPNLLLLWSPEKARCVHGRHGGLLSLYCVSPLLGSVVYVVVNDISREEATEGTKSITFRRISFVPLWRAAFWRWTPEVKISALGAI